MLKTKDNAMKKLINLFNKEYQVYYHISTKVTQYIVSSNACYKRTILKKNLSATSWKTIPKSEVERLLDSKSLNLLSNKEFNDYEKINFLQPHLIY